MLSSPGVKLRDTPWRRAILILALVDAALISTLVLMQSREDGSGHDWWEAKVINFTFDSSIFDVLVIGAVRVVWLFLFGLGVFVGSLPPQLYCLFCVGYALSKLFVVLARSSPLDWAGFAVLVACVAFPCINIISLALERRARLLSIAVAQSLAHPNYYASINNDADPTASRAEADPLLRSPKPNDYGNKGTLLRLSASSGHSSPVGSFRTVDEHSDDDVDDARHPNGSRDQSPINTVGFRTPSSWQSPDASGGELGDPAAVSTVTSSALSPSPPLSSASSPESTTTYRTAYSTLPLSPSPSPPGGAIIGMSSPVGGSMI